MIYCPFCGPVCWCDMHHDEDEDPWTDIGGEG